ncbi:MAG: hypothetical protein ABI212_05975 [Burkholderiaceae bacterium]
MDNPCPRGSVWGLTVRVWLAVVLSTALFGCGEDDGAEQDAEQPQALNCGVDLPRLTQRVYVATGGSDAAGCGQSTATACKTIAQGIANCAAAGCAVLVRHGLYPTTSTIALRDAVHVVGACRFDGEADRHYRTVINAAPQPGTPAVSADGVNSPTVFDSIVVMGKNETVKGVASIAMVVSNSTGLTLMHSVFVAGRGGDGDLGIAPAQSPSGQGGGWGNTDGGFAPGGQGPGGPACNAAGAGAGGAGSAWQQNVVSSCGGFACDCNPSGGRIGSPGGSSGATLGGGGGGPGTQGNACWEGVIRQGLGGQGGGGGPGASGACSARGGVPSEDVWGSFLATSWMPSAGGSGGIGSVGSGGGGGGPGGMCTLRSGLFSWVPSWGLPGGGGGAGGCAGSGGQGGQQGGASVVLLLIASTLPLPNDTVSIVGGQGGHGGHGGTGGVGGHGGGSGGGASSIYNCTKYDSRANIGWGGAGGPGGSGGSGGAGGGGSGGNGGPSVGIALVGGATAPGAGSVYRGFAGSGAGGGTGGSGGANDCTGATGQTGTAGGVAMLRAF